MKKTAQWAGESRLAHTFLSHMVCSFPSLFIRSHLLLPLPLPHSIQSIGPQCTVDAACMQVFGSVRQKGHNDPF